MRHFNGRALLLDEPLSSLDPERLRDDARLPMLLVTHDIVTGYSDFSPLEISREVGSADKIFYIAKPFQVEEVWCRPPPR